MLQHAEKTGRIRHRVQRLGWFGKRYACILQVEERGLHTSYSAGHHDTQWVSRWRDATLDDLTEVNIRRLMAESNEMMLSYMDVLRRTEKRP